ncbi:MULTISPECIES: hypothetical protein [unclassified Nitrospina]|uniref:hypothetical protein n=1 Tax=unclassified Nitrospina TaxID=2638683 RepID=UPI003F9C4DF2
MGVLLTQPSKDRVSPQLGQSLTALEVPVWSIIIATILERHELVWTFVQNMPARLFYKYLAAHLALNLFSLLWFTLKGKPGIILKAKWDAVCGLRDSLKKRRIIQKHIAIDEGALERVMNRDWREPFRVFLRRRR